VHLEYVQEHGLYLPTYPSTIEMGRDLTGLEQSQLYTYRKIGRGVQACWMKGWNTPYGIEAGAEAAPAPVCARHLLFYFVRERKGKKATIRGRLAAEGAISGG